MPVNSELATKRAEKAVYDRARRTEKKVEIAEGKRKYYLANKDKEDARVAAWCEANRGRSRAIKQRYKDANPGMDAAYQLANATQIRATRRAHYDVNKVRLKAKAAAYRADPANTARLQAYFRVYHATKPWVHRNAAKRRRAGVSVATPAWANMEDIRNVYIEARYMQMQVDHIVPLRGKNVCGLHVWANLQLLTPQENKRKGYYHAG